MAEVYKAYHAALDRFVAVKLLHPFLADDSEFKERFEHEAQNVAKLRHPHIVQVYDFDFEAKSESYYMVMELIQGPTLKDMLFDIASEGKMLPIEEALHICRDVGSALAYAHARSMIHRDVKPANIMHDVEESRYVLTDFGIAKIITGTQFTASGGMLGTPAYMAPEQALGEPGDERADIYSLGVILYQLCTGRLPFDADTPLAIILKHVNDPLPDPRELNPGLPEGVGKIIFRAMSKDPDDRYQTAEEMVEHLKDLQTAARMAVKQPAGAQVVSQETKTTITGSASTPVLPTTRRRRTRIPLLLLGVILAAIVAFFALGGPDLLAPAFTPTGIVQEDTETPTGATSSPDATAVVDTASPTDTDTSTPADALTATPVLPRGVLSHAGAVVDVAFSPDGAYIATGSTDHIVRLWDVETGEALLALDAHTRTVNAVAFSPARYVLASAGDDRTVRLWSFTPPDADAAGDGPEPGALLYTLRGHTGAVKHLAFNRYGTLLASAGDDNTIYLWSPDTGEQVAVLEGHTDVITAVAFGPANALLASASADGTVRLWQADPGPDGRSIGAVAAVLEGHTGAVNALAFDPNGQFLASADVNGFIKLWSIDNQMELAQLEGHEGQITSLAYGPLGNVIGSGGIDGTVRIWNPATGQELQALSEHASDVLTIAFSPDNIRLASAGADGRIQLWDWQTGRPLVALSGHTRSVGVLAFSPDGMWLVSGSDDRTARLWAVPDAKPIIALPTSPPTPTGSAPFDLTATLAACNYDYAFIAESYGEPAYYDYQNSVWWFPRLRSFRASITVQNIGGCAWEPDTALVYVGATRYDYNGDVLASDLERDQFGLARRKFTIGQAVERGEEVTIEVDMAAPAFNRRHVLVWELQTPQGVVIGEPIEMTLNVYEDRPPPQAETPTAGTPTAAAAP
ncbi:MAG: protein kinase [Anaerolineae bacterium]|nr:protein kinase [Anaerolineae bacterium]